MELTKGNGMSEIIADNTELLEAQQDVGQTMEGSDNTTDTIDPGMTWPDYTDADGEDVDESFLTAPIPEALTVVEEHTVKNEYFLFSLLKQFPFLIGQALYYAYRGEIATRIVEQYVTNGELVEPTEANALSVVQNAKEAITFLEQGKMYLTRALDQFDPLVNPAAYKDSQKGPVIKSCSLTIGFSRESIKFNEIELGVRNYYKAHYECVQTLCPRIGTVSYENLEALNEWIKDHVKEMQALLTKYSHIEREQSNNESE